MAKAGPAGARSVASAANAPPDDSATRVPITPTPASVPTTQKTSATVTAAWRTRSAGSTSVLVSVLIGPLDHAPVRVLRHRTRARSARPGQAVHSFADYSWPVRRSSCGIRRALTCHARGTVGDARGAAELVAAAG